MHNRYVNSEDRWTKILSAALNVLVNWKGGERPPAQQYEYIKGDALTTKRKYWRVQKRLLPLWELKAHGPGLS